MSQLDSPDIAIVGGGIIGLAVGIALLENNPHRAVVIFEKESSLGLHASGRNSGVIHAGFYYYPEILKAKFCADGNVELKKLCKDFELPLRETGKVVVTNNEDDLEELEKLFYRGLSNNIEIELLDARHLPTYEPAAKTVGKFLWSPTTAIADPKRINEQLNLNFRKLGGHIKYGKTVSLTQSGGEVSLVIDEQVIQSGFVVNAAGTWAHSLSRMVGVGLEFACMPFMGIYRASTDSKTHLRSLVYPVPHPINPFLGVHVTLMLNGEIKIGPTAIPILGREQYSLVSRVSASEIRDLAASVAALIRGKEYNFWEVLKSEFPKFQTKSLIGEAQKLVPSIASNRNWKKLPAGVRAQLVNLETGKLEQDFIVRQHLNSLHVLNAVSPGWTSALPFGRWLSEKI